MNRLQEVQYSMLCRLKKILDENKIGYWLAYGTVLGAVRHKGFIPWDDDIDIYIDGSDYPKLQKVFENGEVNGLELHDFMSCDIYPFTFPKIVDVNTKLIEKRFSHTEYKCGIYIDIFPLYSIGNNKLLRRMGYLKRYINYVIVEAHYTDVSRRSMMYGMFVRLLCNFSCVKAQRRLYKNYCKGIAVSGKKYLNEPLMFKEKGLHYKMHFEQKVDMEFEGGMFPVPGMYDEYLRSQYGEYWILPPEREQCPVHDFVSVVFGDESGNEETNI